MKKKFMIIAAPKTASISLLDDLGYITDYKYSQNFRVPQKRNSIN